MSRMVYCRFCAAAIDESALVCPSCSAPQLGARQEDPPFRRTFGNSISICMQKYVGFEGRAPRAEYWYFTLFAIICQIGIDIARLATGQSRVAFVLALLVWLGLFLPNLAVTVRRLHDVDRPGWWYLLVFLPIVGWILLLVWYCTRGTSGPNRFGADPLPAWV